MLLIITPYRARSGLLKKCGDGPLTDQSRPVCVTRPSRITSIGSGSRSWGGCLGYQSNCSGSRVGMLARCRDALDRAGGCVFVVAIPASHLVEQVPGPPEPDH